MIRICEKWEMETPIAAHNEWFGDWLNRKPHEVSRHITMGAHALDSIRELKADSVHESFGGIGAQALIAEELWPTARHTVRDFSKSAFRYLIENLQFRDGLEVLGGSSYDPKNFIKADIQIADVGDLTAHRWNVEPYKTWLDHTFTSGAKAVVLTDIAGRLLHLHKRTYSEALGRADWGDNGIETYEEYLRAVGDLVEQRYGYLAHKTFYHRWSAITVFVLDAYLPRHELVPCPTTPIGLEILK